MTITQDKKTTYKSSDPLVSPPAPTVEHIEEVKVSDYHLKLHFGTKGSTLGSATELKHGESLYSGADNGRIEYLFKRGTGRLTPSPVTTPATITSSDYCDIYVEGSSSFKLILSTASGKCFIYNE